MSTHSSLVGGSTAGRLLNCPGSYQAIMALPPSADAPSVYAEAGSLKHDVMSELMTLRASEPDADLAREARAAVGNDFDGRVLTQDDVDDAIIPALDMLEALEAEYGGEFTVEAVEHSVRFPGIPAAFGTLDLVLANETTVLLVDWKFGTGIPVACVADNTMNAQLMYYLAGACYSLPGLYAPGRAMAVAIVQPAFGHSHTVVVPVEVAEFIEDMHRAVTLALGRDPVLRKGEHCRFCPAKVSCPQWTGPLKALVELAIVPKQDPVPTAPEPTAYGRYLGEAKTLVDMAAQMKTEIDRQLHAYLEAGGLVPHWSLKPKTIPRKWIDPDLVANKLSQLGLDDADIWRRGLQTFAVVDRAAKRLGVKVPDHLRPMPVSHETTICRDSDVSAIDRRQAVKDFAAALAAVTTPSPSAKVVKLKPRTGTGKGKGHD